MRSEGLSCVFQKICVSMYIVLRENEMRESALGFRLRQAFRGKLVKLNCRYEDGIPDYLYLCVDGRCGLLELKRVARWPVRGGGVDLGLTAEQALWLRGWCRAGGRGLLLAQVGVDCLLFGGEVAMDLRKGLTKDELCGLARWRGVHLADIERWL